MHTSTRSRTLKFKVTTMKSMFALGIMAFCMVFLPSMLTAQSSANYAFTTATNSSLTNMTGATTLITAAGQGTDDASSVANIGFDFWFMGTRYSTFAVSANGYLRLGGGILTQGAAGDYLNSLASANQSPAIAPFWDDLNNSSTPANTKVLSRVTGAAPNRVLSVQWQNIVISYNAATTTQLSTFELRLSETSGRIDLVYGNMEIATGAGVVTASIGFTNGAAANQFVSVTDLTTFATSTSTANNSLINSNTAGQITALSSASDGNRRIFSFVPPAGIVAPTGFAGSFTAVTPTSMTLNWTAASPVTGIYRYAIYNSTDGVNYTFVNSVAVGTNTYNATSLLPSTNYFWRVYSVSEGALSTPPASATQATAAPGVVTSTGSGNWSSIVPDAPWPNGIVPTNGDNVTIADGTAVTIDIPTASCLNLIVGQGSSGELLYVSAPASALTVTFNITVASGGSFNAGAGSLTTHTLNANGNITNNGTLDFFTTAGVGINFTGAASNTFGGTGGTTDVRTININKGTSNANVLELNPSNFSVQGTVTDGTPMAFLTLTNGTFKISGTFTLAGRIFTAAAYTINPTTGFWLNNPNVTVSAQTGTATNNGLFRISQGVFNHGTAIGNLFNLGAASNNVVEGGSLNIASRFGTTAAATIMSYTQTGGTVTVCTVGYSSTSLASFDLGTSASSTVAISGGTIVCQLANTAASTPRDFRNQAGAGIPGVTGGTLQLGNPASGAAKAFTIAGVIPNLVITNTSGNHTALFGAPVTYNNISLDITINSGNVLNLGNQVFLFYGTTLTNNGTLTHNGASSQFVTFKPATNMLYTGTGTVTAPMTALALQNDLNFTIDAASPNIVASRIFVFAGSFVNANKLTLGTGGTTVSTIQIGNTTTPTGGGTFDVSPTFNLGTGGQSVIYLRTTNSKTSGPEINPARTLVALTHDDNDPTHTLTITGGNLSTGTLNLTNGKVINGSNLITVTGATVASITGGSVTSYVAGALARTLPANLVTASTYTFPIGKSGLNAFDLVNPTTNAGGPVVVQAEVFDANTGGTPGNLMQALNTSRYWAVSTTSGAPNLTGTLIRLNDTRGTNNGIAASATLSGVYDHVGGTQSTLTPTSITTTAPALTSLGNFYVMGDLGAATLTNLAITPTGNQCTNVARTVTITATPTGAPVTSVVINYSVNGGAMQTVAMTNTGGNNWSGVIPIVTPSNGLVTWTVVATDGNNLVQTATGASYQDEPLTTVIASATQTTVCSGSPTSLSVNVTATVIPVTPAATAYCTSTHTSGCSGDNIARVVLNTLDNTTGLACGGTTRYTYFNGGGTQTTTLAASTPYSLSLTFGTDGSQYFGAWIDYNHDGTYQTSEFLGASGNAGASGTIAISFTVPTSAYNGLTHIRIVGGNDAAVTNAQACGASSSSFGETQDYDVTITGATYTGPYLGAATYSWSDGTNEVGTTNPLTVNPVSNTSYTVSVTALGCTKASNVVEITTLALPAPPTTGPSQQCGVGTPGVFAIGTTQGNFRWYLTPTGGNALQGHVNDTLQNYSISATTTFYVSIFDGTCESVRTSVLAEVISPDAVQAQVDNNSPCLGTDIELSVTQTGANNTYVFTWTAAPVSGSGIPTSVTGASVIVTPSTAGSYVYTVSGFDAETNCSATSTVSVTVAPLPAVPTPVATPSTVCAGGNVTLSVPQNFIVSGPQTIPGTYCTPTQSGGAQITQVNFNTLSHTGISQVSPFYNIYPASGATTTTVTAGQSYTLSLATIEADGPSIVSVWIDFNRNGQFDASEWFQPWVAATTGSITITIPANAVAGRAGMRVRSRYGGNPSSSADACASFGSGTTVDYAINILGLNPVNPAFTYTWNPGGLTGSSINVNPVEPTTYTVTVVNPATTCSADYPVTVIVNPLPPTPTAAPSEQCGTALPGVSVQSNSGATSPVFNWYLVSTGGTPAQTGTSSVYLTPISATTTFYISEVSEDGCESGRDQVTATVSVPDPITVTATNVVVCLGQSSSISSSYTPDVNQFTQFTLTAAPQAGSGITNPTTLTVTPTGSSPFTVTPTAPGSYIYTITAYDATIECTSVNSITVTVNPVPTNVVATSSAPSVCTGGTVNLFTGSAAPVLNEGFTTVSPLPAGWASQNLSNPVGVLGWFQGNTSVMSAHSGPATSYIAANFNNVSGSGPISNWLFLPNLTMSNGDVFSFWTQQDPAQVRADRLEVRMSTNGASVNVGTTSSSVGDFTTLLLTVNPTSAALGYPNLWTQFTATISGLSGPTSGRIAFRYNIENGGTNGTNSDFIGIDDVTYTLVPSYSWTSNPAGFTSTQQNPTNVPVNANTVFTVTGTNAYGCSLSSSVTVNAIPLPDAPIGTNSSQCGLGVPTASVSTGGANGTFNWYSAETGGTLLQTGGSTYTTAISSTTTFWVAENNGTCESVRTAVTVTVTTPGVISVTGSGPGTICLTSDVSLNASSAEPYTYTWSASPAAGSGIPTSVSGASVTVTPTIAGSYIYTVTGVDNSGPNTCTATATFTVTVNPNPVLDSIRANPATICAGPPSVLTVYSVGFGAGPQTLPAYVAPGTTSNTLGDNITLVNFGSIYNATAGGGTNGFVNYTLSVPAPTVTAGSSYSLTINVANGGTEFAAVWFDWNRNGVYDASEFINIPMVVGASDEWEGTITVNVPANAKGGLIGMRVRARYNAALVAANAYLAYTYGETEEYAINVIGTIATNSTYNYAWNSTPPQSGTGLFSISVTPTQTTTYSVVVTDPATGCSSTSAPVTVTVLPVSAAATATPATPVCAGTSVVLNANPQGGAPFNYSWSDGTTVVGTTNPLPVTPLVTTIYTVTVTDGCGNSTTSSVTVTVNPNPTATIAETGPITVCEPATPLLTAQTTTTNPSYQWLRNGVNVGGATAATYTVTSTGSYTVRIIETSTACVTTSAAISVTINPQPQSVVVTPPSATICDGGSVSLNAVSASNGAATVGTGTVANTTSTPYKGFWGGNKVQYLYTAAELSAQGLTAGASITTLSMNVTAFTGPYTFNGFSIAMKNTASASLTSVPETGTTPVFGPLNYTLTGTAPFTVSHTLTSPFTWNGTSNIVVEFCFNNQNGGGTSANSANVASTTITGRTTYFSADNSATVCTTASGWTTTTTRTNMTFGYNVAHPITWSPATGLNTTTGNTVIASPSVTTTYVATGTNTFGCTRTQNVIVTVNPRPTGVISGGGTYCDGQPTTTALSIAVTGTGPWSGTLSDGTTFSGSASPIVVSVTPTATTTYTIATLTGALCTSVSADLSGSATVTVNPLAANPTATVTQPTCTVGTGTITVTSPLGAGTTYSLDGGAYQSGVTFSGVAPGTHTLTAQTSTGCFSPASTTVTVDPQPFTPAAPVVTGIVNVCPYIATGDQLTYTASAAGATSYVWTMPFNVNLVSGQGTPTIVVTISNNAPGFANQANKQIKVRAVSACGTSAQTIFYLLAQYPSTPGTISGPTNVCALVGTPTQATYTIPAVTAAVNYSWIVPANASITSGQGTTSITVSFLSGYSGGGVIGVTAENGCGPSGTRTLTLSSQPATQPAPISGPVNACEYMAPNGTAATYTTPAAPGVTYTWSASNGAVILTGQGSNSVTVSYPSGYTGGTISVTGTNGCGTGAPRTLNIYRYNPATPSNIDVMQTHFCGEPNGREYTYTLANMPANATSILWTIPATGATILSGQGTISITVAYANTSISGTVTAQAQSNCGASSVRSVTVRLPACPPPGFAKAGITTPAAKTITAASDLEVRVFPNPSVSDFKLEVRTQQNKGEINVRVLDLQGRLYRNFTVMAWQTVSVGAELKAGAYLVEVRQGSVVKTTKLVKF